MPAVSSLPGSRTSSPVVTGQQPQLAWSQQCAGGQRQRPLFDVAAAVAHVRPGLYRWQLYFCVHISGRREGAGRCLRNRYDGVRALGHHGSGHDRGSMACLQGFRRGTCGNWRRYAEPRTAVGDVC